MSPSASVRMMVSGTLMPGLNACGNGYRYTKEYMPPVDKRPNKAASQMDISRTRPDAVRVNADLALAPMSGVEAATVTSPSTAYKHELVRYARSSGGGGLATDVPLPGVACGVSRSGKSQPAPCVRRKEDPEWWPGGCRDIEYASRPLQPPSRRLIVRACPSDGQGDRVVSVALDLLREVVDAL